MKFNGADQINCFHCGESCEDVSLVYLEKTFCCDGCKIVYEILNENNLCSYYSISPSPGKPPKNMASAEKYSFLDDKKNTAQLISFTDGKVTHLTFYIPQMHCNSCIWLLEKFHKINPGIIRSQVNFLKKEITIVFQEEVTTIRAIVEKLAHIGYEPYLSLEDLHNRKLIKSNRQPYLKIGIAGFCFGNIMMLSFPDYFSGGALEVKGLGTLFNYLNLVLSLPVLFYCSSEFFISAWKGIRQKHLNMDAPIVLAILIAFIRSVYEITNATGTGYLDSMSGIVFFMLIGRVFQNKTYQTLSFERDYKSYFPISITIKSEKPKNIPVSEIKRGDRIVVRNNELIPADAILLHGEGYIDYSFVTGEFLPVHKILGEIIYAGGRQRGHTIELEVVKEVSQSYLTELWNNPVFQKEKNETDSFVTVLSNYFSIVVFSIALCAGIYWYQTDSSKALNAATAVLIVACPCALLLSSTFTNGMVMRILGRNKCFLKNAHVIEKLSKLDTIVFDKTGTITQAGSSQISYEGVLLTEKEEKMLFTLFSESMHPLSRAVLFYLSPNKKLDIDLFNEYPSLGIEGLVNDCFVKIGSAAFLDLVHYGKESTGSKVFVSIDGIYKGVYSIKNQYRNGFYMLAKKLKNKYKLVLLSGDNEDEREELSKIFDTDALTFNQSPKDKLEFIKKMQQTGRKVLMVGDGLNDAGALKQSDVGIAVSEEINNFFPASDAILEAKMLNKLDKFISLSKAGNNLIVASFVISILYNIVGIYYSVQGRLQPVLAAILMPASTISIVLFTTVITGFVAKKMKL
jgi:Cu+-exporting ATPase